MEWDDAMYPLFGRTPGAFHGASDDFFNLIHSGDRSFVAGSLAAAVESGLPFEGAFRVLWPDGSVHSLLMQGTVTRDGSGKAIWMTGTCRLSTSENPSGLTADMERTMFAALMDNLPDCIYFKDMNSRMIATSQANAVWFGLKSPRDLIGKTDFDLFTEEHAKQALADEREILDTGLPMINMEEKETWADGRVTYVLTSKMPLRDERGRIIGTFGLSRNITERKRAEEQLARFAEELHLKKEMLEEELAMARELQLAMLPQSFPAFCYQGREAVRFAHFFQPSTAVSGDFFDVYEIAEDRVGVFICDVMGHGVRASLVAAMARALVEQMTDKGMSPEVLLTNLNESLRRILRNTGSPLFVSACYAMADLTAGELVFANAGHPHPIHVCADKAESLEGNIGPVLGLFDDVVYERNVRRFDPGDSVLLFTDGLYEVEGDNEEIYSYARLLQAIRNRSKLPMKELCRAVVEKVQTFAAYREFSDDVCLIGMERV